MKVYRCSVCGYLHIGTTPEKCPMCGAPQTAFGEYVAPSVKGTKTYENLMTAFAGESQANRRYTLFKAIAQAEGASEEAIAAYTHSSNEETAHALAELIYAGGYGDTATNLKTAAEGEAYEHDTMYADFAAQAEKDGFDDIAHFFKMTGRFEGKHRDAYHNVLKTLEEGE